MRAKRVFSILLAAVLALSLLPSAALAEGDGTAGTGCTPLTDAVSGNITSTTSFLAGDEHANHEGWTELTVSHSGTSLASGNYYLKDDVELSNSITVGKGEEVTLCLNGNTLTKSGGKTINVKGTLTICDCSATGAGTIPDKNAVYMESGTLNLLGGVLGGNSGGNGIQESSSSVINIRGGTVKGNGSNAAIKMNGGELHISGGSIGDNSTNYSVELSNESELYLSGDPTFVRKPNGVASYAEIYLVGQGSSGAVENAIYAADSVEAYTGGKLDIALSALNTGLKDGVTIVQSVSVENYDKFALLGIPEGKGLNFDDTVCTLVYGDYVEYVPKHTHGVDGGEGDIEWTKWDGTTELSEDGYYYLEDNVEVRSNLIVSADVHLCLNGKTLTIAGNYFSMKVNGGSLTICDCGNGGEIKRTGGTDSSIAVSVLDGTLILYGGAIVSEAEGVYIYNENATAAKFDMRGGSISAVKGIDNRKGTVAISGGSVTFSGMYGIYSSGGSVSLTGGSIAPLETGDAKYGANIAAGTFHMSGTASVSGRERGIWLALRNDGESASISGGSISGIGDTAYGIYQAGEAPAYLSGTPSISGTGADLYIPTYSYPIYGSDSGALYSGETLTVYYNGYAETTEPIIHSATDISKFTLVYPEGKYLVPSGDNLVLSSTPPVTGHTHDVAGGTEGEAVTWTEWDGTTELEAGGYYYLGSGVELPKAITVPKDVHLCLNGNTITSAQGNEVLKVTTGTLTICDCKDGGEVIISGSSNRAAVRLTNYGKLTLYGGTLDGGSGNGVFASGANTEVTIAGGTVSGTRSGGALGVSGGTATITGGTVNGVKLQNRAELYLGGAPDVGTVSMAKSGTAKGYDNQIFAAADSTAYAGGKITLTSDDDNIPENTVIVQKVNDNNDELFALTGYVLERSEDNLVVGAASAIELSVTVPEGLTYGDTKPLTITVEPADAALAFAFAGQSPNDNGSDKFSVTKGSDGTYSLYAGAAGDFTLTVTATKDGYSQKQETVSFSVGKAALTVKAEDKSITYGDAAPVYTATYSGFVGDDGAEDLTGTLTFTCAYTKGSPVGTYPITPSGLTSDNYNITFVPGTLTVGKAEYPGTVTPPTGLTATYGDTLADVTLPENDDGVWSWKDEDTTSVGNAGGNSFTLIFTPNDTGYNPVEVEATVTVGKAALTVTADNVTIAYGEPKPDFTAQITGFVNGEGKGDLTGTLEFDCAYAVGSPVGTYPIKPKGLTSNNYSISFVDGTLTVTENAVPAPTAPVGKTLTYNAGLQDLIIPGSAEHGTMVYSISQNGPWNAAVPQAKDAGVYTVWYKVVGDPGYSDTAPISVTAVINKAPLTIKALDRRAYVGERIPAFAYDVVGLLGSDTLDKAPSFSCNANMNMPGTYVIRIFGAEAANYDISYVNGILTVEHRFVVSGYKITVVVVGKGEASASAGWADAGSVISVSSKADEGYTLGSITVETESGRSVAMKDGKFTMPNDSVVVTVTFEKKGEPFYDVRPGDWFYDAVIWAYENGIMDGMDIGWFQPDGTVSRAMAVTVLYRMEGQPAVSGSSGFTDVVSGSWYDDAVTWASKNGIVLGVTEDTYRPNDPVTREQLAAILFRYADYKGYDRSASADLTGYADYAEVSAYAVPALRWACGCGIIDGSAGKLDPRSGATRAQLATMLMRFDKAAK